MYGGNLIHRKRAGGVLSALSRVIAIVHPDLFTAAAIELGQLHPDVGKLIEQIEGLNMKLERCFAVLGDETQITQVFFH